MNRIEICDEIFKNFDDAIVINPFFERNDYVLVKRCVNFTDDSLPIEKINKNHLNLPKSYLNISNMDVGSPQYIGFGESTNTVQIRNE